MGQYDWYKKIKKYIKTEDNPSAINIFMTMPSGQRGVYTGNGPDGVLQTNRPAMVVEGMNGPNIVHEGELAVNKGNNIEIIPNNRLGSAVGASTRMLNTTKDQLETAKIADRENIPGFASGGTIPTFNQPRVAAASNTMATPTMSIAPAASTNSTGTNTWSSNIVQTPSVQNQRSVLPKVGQPKIPSSQGQYNALQQNALDFNVSTMNGNNPLQESIANKSRQNYGSQAQSQFGSMAQTALQNPNMTEGARNALIATANRDIATGRSVMETGIAQNKMQAAQEATDKVYNQAGGLITQDIAIQEAKQKMDANQLAITQADEENVANYVSAHTDATGNFNGDINDPALVSYMQKYYQDVTGQPAATMPTSWMQSQISSIANPQKTNARNVAWNEIIGSQDYINAPEDMASAPPGYTGMTKQDYRQLYELTSNNGITVRRNSDGSAYFVDATGNIISGTKQKIVPTITNGKAIYPDTSDGQSQMQEDYNKFITYYGDSGITIEKWLDIGAPSPDAYNPNAVTSSSALQTVGTIMSGNDPNIDMTDLTSTVQNELNGLFETSQITDLGKMAGNPKWVGTTTLRTIDIGNGQTIERLDNAPAIAHKEGEYNVTASQFLIDFIDRNRGKIVNLDGNYYRIDPTANVGVVGISGREVPFVRAYDVNNNLIALELYPSGWNSEIMDPVTGNF